MQTLNVENIKQLVREQGVSKGGHRSSPRRRAIKILDILERDEFKCVKCGSNEELTIDHPEGRIFARYDNFQKYKLEHCRILCKPCHMARHGIKGVKE